MTVFYTIAFFSLFIGMGAMLTLVEKVPLKYLYYHYHFRKPVVLSIFIASLTWVLIYYFKYSPSLFPMWTIPPLLIIMLSVVLSYKMHQENWFKAVDFPEMTNDIESLPLKDENQLAIIEIDGVVKAYPLDYVIHHHIINDRFGDRIIALTYCAMCRSIIPFDVTEIGPLFVASFKNANMIVADKKTKTFFQQETFNSVIGKLHPHLLDMVLFQILSWKDLKKINPIPQIAIVKENDFRPFKLPMPGVWKKVMSSELTPGLINKDKTFPSKTHVVGIIDSSIKGQPVYLKKEVLSSGVVKNDDYLFTLISSEDTVNGFKNSIDNHNLELSFNENQTIMDINSGTNWDLRGKYISGKIDKNLKPIAISDEYWFSWKNFHPDSLLIRLY